MRTQCPDTDRESEIMQKWEVRFLLQKTVRPKENPILLKCSSLGTCFVLLLTIAIIHHVPTIMRQYAYIPLILSNLILNDTLGRNYIPILQLRKLSHSFRIQNWRPWLQSPYLLTYNNDIWNHLIRAEMGLELKTI